MATNVITRDVIAERLAERAEITMTAARDEVRWFFDTISEELTRGNEVRIHGFATFRTAQRGAHQARNPRTGEAVMVGPRRVVRFAPSTTLAAALRGTSTRGKKAEAKKATAKKSK